MALFDASICCFKWRFQPFYQRQRLRENPLFSFIKTKSFCKFETFVARQICHAEPNTIS